jgi:hypothetical protein
MGYCDFVEAGGGMSQSVQIVGVALCSGFATFAMSDLGGSSFKSIGSFWSTQVAVTESQIAQPDCNHGVIGAEGDLGNGYCTLK